MSMLTLKPHVINGSIYKLFYSLKLHVDVINGSIYKFKNVYLSRCIGKIRHPFESSQLKNWKKYHNFVSLNVNTHYERLHIAVSLSSSSWGFLYLWEKIIAQRTYGIIHTPYFFLFSVFSIWFTSRGLFVLKLNNLSMT